MKKLVRTLIYFSISLCVLNCADEEKIPIQGKVQFTISLPSSADGGRVSSQSFPDDSYISLSIVTASNASVHSLEKVDFIKLGDGYITSPLALAEGNYHITDFFVMSPDDEVLYATPKADSPLAGLVEHPLPMNFSITRNGIVNLDTQVVSADQHNPSDFGYVSFSAEIVGSDFSISLFADDNNGLSLTAGALRLYKGNDLVYTQELLAKVNPVNFKGDPDATYTLVVEKEGYAIKTKEFALHALLDELNGKPFSVLLSPASTITVLVKDVAFPVELNLSTSSENVLIDWGDGIHEHAGANSTALADARHTYAEPGRYFVNITGDLNAITTFDFQWLDYERAGKQDIENVDVTRLSELKSFRLYWRITPDEINFRMNSKLEVITMLFTTLKHIDISNNPHLRSLDLTESGMTLANFIQVIDDLHHHATGNNIQDGWFTYGSFYIEPIPEESMEKLRDLQNNYSWDIYPYI